MAHYLVTAAPRRERLAELEERLAAGAFLELEPFGRELSRSVAAARLAPQDVVMWEEEDYCRPPLAEERAAVLDRYFADLRVQRVRPGAGWEQIAELPRLFPRLPRPTED